MSQCEIGKMYLFHIKKPGSEQILTKIKNKIQKQINFVEVGSKVT